MSRLRAVALAFVSILPFASPASTQAPQFRANIQQTGDAPFAGTIYFGNGRMRIEGVSDGQQLAMIIDSGAGTLVMLMPEDRMYMTMDLGSAPFSAPAATSMDPANPCSSGEVSDCRSLGSETVNGYAARGWEYTRDGERETAWIASELRFPVRTIDADGATTDMTDVRLGPQPASLFAPPGDYTAMTMPGFGGVPGGRGRGQVPPGAGRGTVPPGAGRGAVQPGAAGRGAPAGVPGGVDPAAAAQLTAQLQAMGLPPDQIAMALAQLGAMGTVTNSAPWEAVEAWVADIVVTASGSESAENREGGRFSETYSLRFTGSVPIPYGTPAVGAAMGPAWQLVPSLGTDLGLAQPLRFSGTAEYRSELNRAAECVDEQDAFRRVIDSRTTAELNTTDHGSMAFMSAGGRVQISGDLTTFDLLLGAGAAGSEVTTTVSTTMGSCPNTSASTETETGTREQGLSVGFQLMGLPLAASPGTMRGTNTVPIRFVFGGFEGELDADVEWTLRPIS